MNTALSFLLVIAIAAALVILMSPTTLIGKYRSQLALQLFIAFGFVYALGLATESSPESITAAAVKPFAVGLLLYSATEGLMHLVSRGKSERLQKFLNETCSVWLVGASLYTISTFEMVAHDRLIIVVGASMIVYMLVIFSRLYHNQATAKSLLETAMRRLPRGRKPAPQERPTRVDVTPSPIR